MKQNGQCGTFLSTFLYPFTFAVLWVPSNFTCNLLIKLQAEGLETRVEPSVLQQLGEFVEVGCQVTPHCVVNLV